MGRHGAGFSAAVSVVSVIMIVGLLKLHARGAPALDLKVAATPEQILRGQAISNGFCSACHSRTGTLTGGLDVAKDLPVPIGSFVSSNLTPAGQLSHRSDGDIFQAIRNGVAAEDAALEAPLMERSLDYDQLFSILPAPWYRRVNQYPNEPFF